MTGWPISGGLASGWHFRGKAPAAAGSGEERPSSGPSSGPVALALTTLMTAVAPVVAPNFGAQASTVSPPSRDELMLLDAELR